MHQHWLCLPPTTGTLPVSHLGGSTWITISQEALGQAFTQALGESLPHILTALQGNASVNSASTISSVPTGGRSQLAVNISSSSQTPPPSMAGSSQPPMSLATGNIVVPPFISFYCTLGNPIPSSQAAPSFGSRSASSFSLPASPLLVQHLCHLVLLMPRVVPWASPPLGKAFVVGPGYSGLVSLWN